MEFPVPESVTQVRQFLRLTSYYRCFVSQFAKVNLTQKDVQFRWTNDCQEAFDVLKRKLTQAPILAYPDFEEEFVLETDACVKGLGAVLSQRQESGQVHPIAFASRALSPAEKNYSITELETLAVVWSVQHFRAYLYCHDVTVVTDHSAVRAVLETLSPSGKHARWWLKVFGCGVGKVKIVYRPGRENGRADALSRNPLGRDGAGEHLELGVQVAQVISSELETGALLGAEPIVGLSGEDFLAEQRKDVELKRLIDYLEQG